MMVYVDTPASETYKVFRTAKDAVIFAARHKDTVQSVSHSNGRIIVRFKARATRKVWSRNANETKKHRNTYALPLDQWPEKYR